MDNISAILSEYITERDNAKKRTESPLYVAGDRGLAIMTQFSAMVNAYHQRLFAELPTMNINGVTELANRITEMLDYMRAHPQDVSWNIIGVAGQNIQLPILSQAQIEAMDELCKSRLGWMRTR